jgi:hypothetical protein
VSQDVLVTVDVADLVERVALRVVELLDERDRPSAGRLVDAATLARLLGVSRATVYEHADRLGAVRLGDGDRPRMRFDVEKARHAWTAREGSEQSQPAEAPEATGMVRRRRRSAARSGDDLLPVRDQHSINTQP